MIVFALRVFALVIIDGTLDINFCEFTIDVDVVDLVLLCDSILSKYARVDSIITFDGVVVFNVCLGLLDDVILSDIIVLKTDVDDKKLNVDECMVLIELTNI